MKSLLTIVALPAVQMANLVRYVRVQRTGPKKVGAALALLPVFLITSAIWASAWMVTFGLAAVAWQHFSN